MDEQPKAKPLTRPPKPKPTQPFSITEFRGMVRNNFLYNLKSGILLDLTKQLEEHEVITRTGLESALKEAEKSVKSIDLFLADQLKDNSSLEHELKTVTQMKLKMEKDLDQALKKMGDLKVDLFKRIESIRETMQCRDFLHTVSPQPWLADYQTRMEKHRKSCAPTMERLKREFDHFMGHMGDMDKEVEKIVKEFIQIFQTAGPEMVPFKEGGAISGVIKKMEKNNMEMLVHIRGLHRPLDEERKTLRDVKTIYKEEISEVVKTLSEITENFSFLKERNARLDSIIHDMMKCFKKQVASPDVLRDRALLESLYKRVVNADKPKASASEMWKEIDKAFIHLRCKVGSSSKDEIERRRISINKMNAKQLKEAEKARNRVRQMEQMVKGVRKAFWAPALPKTKKPMRPRSQPPPAPPASPPPASPLGEDYTLELEYQSKLVQPLALPYDIPEPEYRGKFANRDAISPDSEGTEVSQKTENVEDEPEKIAEESLEVPSLPKIEKFDLIPDEQLETQ